MATKPLEKQHPVASWSMRHLNVTLWERKVDRGSFFDVAISRSYKDESKNEWRETPSFDYAQLPLLMELIGQAFKAAMKADIEVREEQRQKAAHYPQE
jgi:hypothetical protein